MPQTTSAPSEQGPRNSLRGQLQYSALVPVAIVVAGLYFGRPVLMPLAVGILLAFALAPLVVRLRRWGVGRVSSVLVSGMLAIAIMIGVGAFVGMQVVQLADELPSYQSNLVQKIQAIRGTTIEDSALARFSATFKNLRDQLFAKERLERPAPAPQLSTQRQGPEPVPVEVRQPEPSPLDLFIMFATPLVAPLVAAAIVFVFVIFILLYKEDVRDRFIRLAAPRDLQRATLLLDEGAERLSRYLLTQTAINASFGAFITFGLWAIGVPNAALWGLCVMLLRFVPYIGVPLAAISPIVLALSIDSGWSLVAATAALFFAGEVIVGQAVEPWLFGRNVGLSPVAVIVAATFWTWLWGPIGLLLSTPITMCLMVLGRHFDQLQFLDILFGNSPALAAEEALYLRMLGDDGDEAAAEAESFLKQNSLCRYYEEVVLKALVLGQADVNRGALDHDRVLKIRDATRALIADLSDLQTEDTTAPPLDAKEADARQRPSRPDLSVLCVAGRNALDEASALLTIHLLEQYGVGARLASSNETSAANVGQLDAAGIKVVALCYLEPGNFARARYLLRRLRRHMPRAVPIAMFWGYSDNRARASEHIDCEVATGLEEATQKILAIVDPDREWSVIAEHAGAKKPAVRSDAKDTGRVHAEAAL
jgi:predicted PurR-regulated permease PerM